MPPGPPLPAILFEGDPPDRTATPDPDGTPTPHATADTDAEPVTPPAANPARHAAAGRTEVASTEAAAAEAPHHGADPVAAPGSLWLTARDPFTVAAHWTFDTGPSDDPAGQAGTADWNVRVREDGAAGAVLAELPVPAGTRFCLVPVPQDASRYVAELGYRDEERHWHPVAQSHPAATPRGLGSVPDPAPWAGTPPHAPLPHPGAPARDATPTLMRSVWQEFTGHLPASSAEGIREGVAETSGLRPGLPALPSSPAPVAPGTPAPAGAPANPASAETVRPAPGPDSRRDFWLEVNAEVILHGRTEPDARVTIAGRRVALRPDGSFSFRFALPDGLHALPVEGRSADGLDTRSVRVTFSRETVAGPGVGAAPGTPGLLPPGPDALRG